MALTCPVRRRRVVVNGFSIGVDAEIRRRVRCTARRTIPFRSRETGRPGDDAPSDGRARDPNAPGVAYGRRRLTRARTGRSRVSGVPCGLSPSARRSHESPGPFQRFSDTIRVGQTDIGIKSQRRFPIRRVNAVQRDNVRRYTRHTRRRYKCE